ncbi:hypothetical protein [Roseibium sp.]|uniref:hypothetical protein n=1 Tax=Roseibium sp. TaxID=1936156 RepID=UPI00327FE4FD
MQNDPDALRAEGFNDWMMSSTEAAKHDLVEFAIAGSAGKRWVINPTALHPMFQTPGLYWRPASGEPCPATTRWVLPGYSG